MGDLSKCKCKENIHHRRRVKITGTKWEQPIPKSNEYWKKFCDNEEKRLIVVRNPFLRYSYHSISKNDSELPDFNTNLIDNAYNFDSSFHVNTDENKTFENSLHRLSCNDTKLFPKAALKTPLQTSTKISDRGCSLPKVVRIPKLDTKGPQPSSDRIFPVKVDHHIRASFGIQNESKAPSKSSSTDSTALPMLDKFLATSSIESTLNKLQKHLKLLEKRNIPEKVATSWKNRHRNKTTETDTEEREHTKSRDETKDQKLPTDRVSLRYSTRFAYKALKHLTSNKNLNFTPKIMEQLSEKSLPKLSEDTSTNGDEKVELLKRVDAEERKQDSKKSLYGEDTERKSIKDSEFTGTDVEGATLKSDQATSKTIPSESRYTSGPSLEFMYPESRESTSARVLASIPRLSGFPRKNCDRCLPCMYRSFEAPLERKISFPRTALQRIISSKNVSITPSSDSSEDSSFTSVSIANLENERMLNDKVECNDVTFDEQNNAVESQIVAEAVQEQHQIVEVTTERKSITDSGISCKTIMKKIKENDSSWKNLKDIEAKPFASFRSESSEEDDSIVISISDEQAKPKYLVPCHAPTVFRPSLEPLRALRHRKPTTLQDRIARLESSSLKKSASIDDLDDVQEKPESVSKDTLQEGKPPPPLMKAKSVLEKLTPEKMQTPPEKKEHILKKGFSFSNFSTSTDFESDNSETLHKVSEDTIKELKAILSKSDSKLPLTKSDEIVGALGNIEESSSTNMLEILCKEFSERLLKSTENDKLNGKKRRKTIATLTRLLVDSKRYLYPDKFPSDLLFSTNQPICCNPRILRRILPLKSYNLIAPVLGLPEWHRKKRTSVEDRKSSLIDQQRPDDGTVSDNDSLLVQPPTLKDIESLSDKEKLGQRRYNPYALFMKKPRRKVVTWRPLKKRDMEGYDPDATLKMRAENTMNTIFHDFCQWVETLGGTDKTIDEEALWDMFEIDFDAEACKAMQVSIREMPVVPTAVALTRNSPDASKLAMTRKHVMKDVKAEQKPAKIKAFGTSIPWDIRFVPPNNQVERRWLQCDNVPKDLETMDVVWKDITHLRSVRGYVEWLKQHPAIPQPEALKKIVSMDAITLKQTEDDEAFAHLELDINEIKSFRVPDSADITS
ncbi:uncharacterized protein LOC117600093 [Osmia lignaria lignaria]|uniref:uncharacterized protein LOC117600093 n=1 Tax=Osmia lignaria lignaria TaxID=1437193 RepID=UPI00402BE72D